MAAQDMPGPNCRSYGCTRHAWTKLWPDQKVSDQGPGKTNKTTYGVAVKILFRHRALVPAALPLSETLSELTDWNSQQLSHHVSFYLLRA